MAKLKTVVKTSQYKIEAGIPIPEIWNRGGYPFADMKVGDSFVVAEDKFNAASSAACNWAKRNGVKFTARRTSLRIWMVE